jgi:hypothetical protein
MLFVVVSINGVPLGEKKKKKEKVCAKKSRVLNGESSVLKVRVKE